MSIRAAQITGSGGVAAGSEVSYSYAEDVSSLEPGNITGGNGQLTLTAIANDEDASWRTRTKLAINNIIRIDDERVGSIEFQARQVSINNQLAVITGETIEGRMNVERTAQPEGRRVDDPLGFVSLKEAIQNYCALVDVFPVFDEDLELLLEARPVNFIGWQGNVWELLKSLCASVSASSSEYVPFEMVVEEDTLRFRIAQNRRRDLLTNADSVAIEINTFDSAQNVDINLYKTDYRENAVVSEDSDVDRLVGFAPGVSISDQLQVEAGEALVKRFKINASLKSVNTPVPVASISSIPYTGTTGEYVVVGSDDLPIQPTQWLAQGGSLGVFLTENPNEIEIRITAPEATSLQQAGDPNAVSLAPYKIGVESSGGVDYPALYITGTGVFFERTTYSLPTGAATEYTSEIAAPEIDSVFITTKEDLFTRGVASAQVACGPSVAISISNPVDLKFADTVGAMVEHDGNEFRIESAAFSSTTSTAAGVAMAPFADFNSIWDGKTFADFTLTMSDPEESPDDYITFNEFSTIPLNREI
jgi:hypothetical protein